MNFSQNRQRVHGAAVAGLGAWKGLAIAVRGPAPSWGVGLAARRANQNRLIERAPSRARRTFSGVARRDREPDGCALALLAAAGDEES